MNSISNIAFNFRAIDEAFVRNLYVGWDSFYRDSFDAVVDEFLSRHNEEGRLLRIDKLELNLGNIPQEDFYLLFPVRLREELERVFLFRSAQVGVRESFAGQLQRRLACLKFYLEKGFCPTEWEDAEFDLEKEIRFLLPHVSVSMAHLFHESVRLPNQLYRLKWNLSGELFGHLMLFWLEDKSIPRKEKEQRYAELRKIDSTLEPSLHKMLDTVPLLSEKLSALLSDEKVENDMSWLLSTTVSVYEKRRILSGLLEWQPTVVIRYIHETQDEKSIHLMAVLLDKMMVRQIINAECEDHTEADVPAYWMYLYNWLLKYYPFNGIYMFGNKLQFQEYLNVKLLQFIRKRSYSAFLSKTDVTVLFLIEVFGQEYYLEVLNIIYNQQARNEDGSPVYTDYLNMELYYMFLHLSLLKTPVQASHSYDAQALNAWLADKRIAPKEKRVFLALLVREHPSLLIKVLETQAGTQVLLAEWMDQALIYELLSSVSFYATELFMKLTEYVVSTSGSISWLSGITSEHLSLGIRMALLRWMGESKSMATDSAGSVSLFMRMLYQEISGNASGYPPSVSLPGLEVFSAGQEAAPVPEWVSRLRLLLMNKAVTDAEKQRALARLLDTFRHRCDELISMLKEQSLLKPCLRLMDKVLFDQLVRQLVRKGCEVQSVTLFPFYQWILANHPLFSAFFSGNAEVMREKMIVLLAHWAAGGSVKDRKTPEIALLFLTGMFGADNVPHVLRMIHQELLNSLAEKGSLVEDGGSVEYISSVEDGSSVENDSPGQISASEGLLALLLRMSGTLGSLPSGDLPEEGLYETDLSASTPEEQDAEARREVENKPVASSRFKEDEVSHEWDEYKLAEWLKNPNISPEVKRQVIRKYIIWQPERIFTFIHRLINKQTIFADEWVNWLDEEDLMHIIAGISLSKAEVLDQIVISLRQRNMVTDSSILLGIICYLTEKELSSWLRESVSETARRFIPYICRSDMVDDGQGISQNPATDDIVSMVINELLIKDMEDNMKDERLLEAPEYINAHNAGLALLAPWFPRLFTILGMLNEERKDFKDNESRIRAIYILQRLVTSEDKEYKESDLAFNRILVNCPFYEPLPANMKLTEEELETIESMLNGVKGNWAKVQNISIRGFQHNFIERSGRMEQKDDKWLLTVDPRAYDMLLDSVPWSYSRIQFPWLPMPVQVTWRSKQEF